MGLFEQPYVDEALLAQVGAQPEHSNGGGLRNASMVLLKNG